MAFSEIEKKRLEKVVGAFVEKHRPASHIRSKLDFAFRIEGQSVVLFEVRPRWQGAPGELKEQFSAKATYVRTRKQWNVYWMRADLRWHASPTAPTVLTIEEFLSHVARDEHGCFFG